MNTPLYDITIAITSCGRFHLLEKTIRSLNQSVDLSRYKKIMTEDSRDEKYIAKIKEANETGFLQGWEILYTQGSGFHDPLECHKAALDVLYSKITTSYTFHCEDDRYFKKTEFDYILLSKCILEQDTSMGIILMTDFFSLNERNIGMSKMKIENIYFDNSTTYNFFGHTFVKMKDYDEMSICYSLNPGLRRTLETKEALNTLQDKVDEYLLGKVYKQNKLQTVNFTQPICKHSGHIFFSTRFFKDGFFPSLKRVIKNAYKYYFTLPIK